MLNVDSEVESNAVILDSQHPWPGLAAFSESNAEYFFGRDSEINDIFRLTCQEMLTILFGRSGLGKSSILRAGLSPKLREANFVPIYIRLNHQEETLPLEDQVEVFIESAIATHNIDAPQPVRSETLWEYFHKKENDWWDQDNNLLKPVLIFDQFEEILTIGHENAERARRCIRFLTELEDLIENRPPAVLAERFKAEKGLAKSYNLERTDYRVILSLREDYLADLESLRDRLRSSIRGRYRLLPMSERQAESVIISGGGHLVDSDVAHKIIDFVASPTTIHPFNERGIRKQLRSVDPSLLGVILRELNNHRLRKGDTKISLALIADKKPQDILSEFYESGIQGLGVRTQKFVEMQLLTAAGARNRVAEDDAIKRFSINLDTINALVNRRIIQRDRIANTTWIELSHDTLAPVVNAHAEKSRRRQKLRRILLSGGAIILAAAAISIGLYKHFTEIKNAQNDATATLALHFTDEIESNSSLSLENKGRIMTLIDNEFRKMLNQNEGYAPLKIRNAEFMVQKAFIYLEHGHINEASTLIEKIRPALLSPDIKGAAPNASLLTRAKATFLDAQISFYNQDIDSSLNALQAAKKLLSESNQAFKQEDQHLLEQKINRLEIENLLAKGILAKTLDNATNAQSTIRNLIQRIASKETSNESEFHHIHIIRSLYKELFALYRVQLLLANHQIGDIATLTKLFTEDLSEYENKLKNDNSDDLNFYRAIGDQIESKALSESADEDNNLKVTQASRSSQDRAVKTLTNLSNENADNLIYRHSLANALFRRAWNYFDSDRQQAEIDLKKIKALALTLQRDSQHSYYYYDLMPGTDAIQLKLINNGNNDDNTKTEDSLALFNQLKARCAARNSGNTTPRTLCNTNILRGYYDLIRSMASSDNNNDALPTLEKSLEFLESIAKGGADDTYKNYWHAHLIVAALNTNASGKSSKNYMGDENKANLHKSLQSILFSGLANQPISHKSWQGMYVWSLADLAATELAKGQNDLAIEHFKQCISFNQNQKSKLPEVNSTIYNNAIWATAQLIKIHNEAGSVADAIADTNNLFELITPKNSETPLRYPDKKLPYLKLVESEITNAINLLTSETSNESQACAQPIQPEQNLTPFDSACSLRIKLIDLQVRSQQIIATLEKQIAEKSQKSKDGAIAQFSSSDASQNTSTARSASALEQNQVSNTGWSNRLLYTTAESYSGDADSLLSYKSKLGIAGEISHIHFSKLPFYKAGRLVTVEYFDSAETILTHYYLESSDKAIIKELDGTSPPIHAANKEFPLQITDTPAAAAYLRFFCAFIGFPIIESAHELPWIENTPFSTINSTNKLVRPLNIWRSKGQTKWNATATIAYKGAVFHADLTIDPSGMVVMDNDVSMAENLTLYKIDIHKGILRQNSPEDMQVNIIQGMEVSDLTSEIRTLISLYESSPTKIELINQAYTSLHIAEYIESPYQLYKLLLGKSSLFALAGHDINDDLLHLIQNAIRILNNKIENSPTKEAGDYLTLSFLQLFSRDYPGALDSANQGLAIKPDYIKLQTNRAHALLLLGKEDEAMEIYRKYKGTQVDENSWEHYILDDLNQLESAGITHRLFSIIRAELAEPQQEQKSVSAST